jgi:DNA repair exonuclease SbcCD ATPase subunit
MEAGLYTLEEASGLTGLSIEALRKRVTRRKLTAVKGNDGRVRVRLDDQTAATIKQDSLSGQSVGRPGRRPDGQSPDKSRMINVIEAALAEVMAVRTDLDRERTRADRAEAEADRERGRAGAAETAVAGALEALAKAETELTQLRQATKTTERILREAESALVAERAAKAKAEAAVDQARADAQQATQEVEALRQAEVARVAAQAMEPAERPAMVASKIDEVQFRRLQEAEQARKALGLVARLRAALRGD